jgi:3-oxoacyl-[acyl-carrier-protein] synthase II
VVLPTAGLRRPDPACELPHVLGAAIEKRVRAALVNSFAFGGANCSLVLRGTA